MSSLLGSGDDFVLMCGPANQALIDTQLLGAVNNVCVLNHKNKRIIGTTLNKPLADPVTKDDFITSLEQSFRLSYGASGSFGSTCDETSDNFDLCVDNNYVKLYYDDTFNRFTI